MNKKGLSLIELLGALVIMGIAISMSAILINFFVRANDKITASNKANYESVLFIQTMKNEFDALQPNQYDVCPGNKCLILIEEYTYELNEVTNSIELIIFDPPLEIEIKFENLAFYKNNVPYVFDGFTLSADSELLFEVINNVLYINFDFHLVSAGGDVYDYTMTYSYTLSNIPVA